MKTVPMGFSENKGLSSPASNMFSSRPSKLPKLRYGHVKAAIPQSKKPVFGSSDQVAKITDPPIVSEWVAIKTGLVFLKHAIQKISTHSSLSLPLQTASPRVRSSARVLSRVCFDSRIQSSVEHRVCSRPGISSCSRISIRACSCPQTQSRVCSSFRVLSELGYELPISSNWDTTVCAA